MSWNVQGLNSKLNQSDFRFFCNKFDIFSCSEIHNCSKELMEKTFYNHDAYVSYRKNFKGGGIAVFVLKSLSNVISNVQIHLDECIVLSMNKKFLNIDKDIIYCFPYIPHEYSSVFYGHTIKGMERLIELFESLYLKFSDHYWVLGGDLNARTGNLHDFNYTLNLQSYLDCINDTDDIFDDEIPFQPRKTRDPFFVNNYGKQFIEFCKCNSFCILNGRTPDDDHGHITCIANKGKTIVDYFSVSVNFYDYIKSFKIIPRSESDHFPLALLISGNDYLCNQITKSKNENESSHSIHPLTWDASKIKEYSSNLQLFLENNDNNFKTSIENNDIDTASNLLSNCIIKASSHMQKDKNFTNHKINSQPKWWDHTLKELKICKYNCLYKFHQSNDTTDLEKYLQAKRNFKNACTTNKKKYQDKTINELIEKSEQKNSKAFWQHFKYMLDKPYKNPTINIPATEWYNNFKQLFNSFNDDCITIVSTTSPITSSNVETADQIIEQILHGPITYNEIDKSLNNLKAGKACGSDGIGPEFYKVNSSILKEHLYILFNKIFEIQSYPTEWSKSLIYPLHKKGNLANVQNYRGISLLNVISKIFTGILFDRLTHWSDINVHIPESQAGGRKGYSTIDNIFCLQSVVQKYLTKKCGRFYVLFVDFSRAYDSIQRCKLWELLIQKGLKGNMLNMLQSMHSNVLAAVRTGKYSITDYFHCMNGVKQGCILSTLLFSLYVSKLESILKVSGLPGIQILPNDVDVFLLMYIDDICIFSDNVLDLQKKINLLETYCNEWGLRVNTTKTKIIVFRNGGTLKKSEKWVYKGEQLESVTYYSYLGLLISSRLCWTKCIETLSCKAQQILSKVRVMCNKYEYFTNEILFKIFDTKIKPIILYGSEIWGVKRYTDVENVHIKFCKIVLNVGKTTWNFAAIAECNRYPKNVDYHYRAVKYWCKLITSDKDRYTSKCYSLMYQHDASGRHNWASDMRILLCSLGFGYTWYQQSVGDVKYFLYIFKERLKDISRQEWYSRAQHCCPEYLDYNPSPFASPHIKLIVCYKKRRIFSLLRTQSLPIKNNLLRLGICNNNLCEKCSGVYVENEFHILFRCSAYTELRLDYIPNYYVAEPSIPKLHQLYKSNDKQLISRVIVFITKSLGARL